MADVLSAMGHSKRTSRTICIGECIEMMKLVKKAMAAFLAALMMLGATSCSSGDNSWAVKYGDKTVPIGVYIYCLFTAYNSALTQVEDSSQDVLSQQVEGVNAEQWIRDNAMEQLKTMLLIEDKMAEMNLTLTEDEQSQADQVINSMWSQYSSQLEAYGISQSSFEYALTQMTGNYTKVFSAYYGADGPSPVSDDELKSYFEENYTDFQYLLNAYQNNEADEDGSYAMTEEQKTETKAEMDELAEKITAGEMTVEEAETAYEESVGENAAMPLSADTVILSSSTYPEEFINLLNEMSPGEARTIEVALSTQPVYTLVIKNDITKKTESQFSTESGKLSVLSSMKSEEFQSLLQEEANALTGVEVNQSAIDGQKLSKFA